MKRFYEFGGKRFIPHSKLEVFSSFGELKVWINDDPNFLNRPFSYKDFYKAMRSSYMDVFKCVETGLLYIPSDLGLLIYDGVREPEVTHF